jgi:hypothetical protein
MLADLKLASEKREQDLLSEEIDKRLDLFLSNYQRVTANPRSMGYLRFLLKHYAKSPTPWRDCVKDNTKRFGPERVKGLCGVLKDTIRQTTYWRGKKGHSKVPDVGDPGYAIGEADKGAAPPWGGHGHHLSETNLDMGEMAMPEEICLILEDWGKQCDPYRVLIGLEDPPRPSAELEAILL